MATYKGKSGVVRDGTNALGEVTQYTIDTTAETADSTAMGQDWRTHLQTLNAWSGSVTCWYDDADTGQTAFATGATVTVEVRPNGNAANEPELSGSATVTGRSVNAAVDGIVTLTLNITGNGPLTEGTVSL